MLSALPATQSAPARSATQASARSVQAVSWDSPCTTATGRSSAVRTGRRPASATSSANEALPSTSTAEPGGSRSTSTATAACALVTTSAGLAGMPSSHRWAATAAGRRLALFVT